MGPNRSNLEHNETGEHQNMSANLFEVNIGGGIDENEEFFFDEEKEESNEHSFELTEPGGEDTEVHLAVEKGDKEELLLLLKGQVYLFIRNPDGLTPLQLAVELGHHELIAPLMDHGSESDIITLSLKNSPRPIECLSELLKYNISFNDRCVMGRTILQITSDDQPERIEFMMMLLDAGFDLSCADRWRNNVLHTMAKRDFNEKPYLPVVQLFIERGIDVEAVNFYNETPLEVAIDRGNPHLVSALLRHPANICKSSWSNPILLDRAFRRKKFSCLREIITFSLLQEMHGDEVDKKMMLKIKSKEMSEHYHHCLREIQSLRELKILNTTLSFYDIICKPKSRVAKYLRNENVLNGLDEQRIKSSRFYDEIVESWKIAVKRKVLEDSAMHRVGGILRLPELCIEKIIFHLDDDDLMKLNQTMRKLELLVT